MVSAGWQQRLDPPTHIQVPLRMNISRRDDRSGFAYCTILWSKWNMQKTNGIPISLKCAELWVDQQVLAPWDKSASWRTRGLFSANILANFRGYALVSAPGSKLTSLLLISGLFFLFHSSFFSLWFICSSTCIWDYCILIRACLFSLQKRLEIRFRDGYCFWPEISPWDERSNLSLQSMRSFVGAGWENIGTVLYIC